MLLSQFTKLVENQDRPSQRPDFLPRTPEFQQLRDLAGEKLASDIAVAWQGDVKDYARTGGKNFQPLVAQMLNDRVVERRYGVEITPPLRKILSALVQLAHHAFPDTERLRGTTNATYSGGVWGNAWARECATVEFDEILYEVLKADVVTLLSEEDNQG